MGYGIGQCENAFSFEEIIIFPGFNYVFNLNKINLNEFVLELL